MTQAYAENWSRILPYIQLVYNTTPRAGSSLSAYDVVFARQPRMPRSALLPPRTTVAGNAPEDLFEINVQQVATSLREAWSALRRANLEKNEAERLPVAVTFAEGDQVLVLYSAGAKRRNKHYMASEGPCTVTKINGNDYEVRNNATNNIKARRVVSMGSRAWLEAARRMPAHELESAALMYEIKRRSSELMQTLIRLETDSEASTQMLSMTTVSQLPARYQRWRALLTNFESVKVHYVGYKGVAMADQLSRQAKWYKTSSSLLLQVAVVTLGYTAQDVEDITAALLGDHPQALMIGPVALDTERLAREATRLSRLLAAQASCPEAQEMRKQAHRRPDELNPGDMAVYIAGPGHDLPGALCRDTMDGTTLLEQVFLPTSMREQAIMEVHELAHAGSKGTYKAYGGRGSSTTCRRRWTTTCAPACRACRARPRRGRWRQATTGAARPASCTRPCRWTSSS